MVNTVRVIYENYNFNEHLLYKIFDNLIEECLGIRLEVGNSSCNIVEDMELVITIKLIYLVPKINCQVVRQYGGLDSIPTQVRIFFYHCSF